MTIEIRPLEANELPEFAETFAAALGLEVSAKQVDRMAAFFNRQRLRVAVDRGRIVATFGAHDLPITIPGAIAPLAGTTVVTVLPTHRRQGLLRRLMTEHLKELQEEGQCLAGLWASEGSIYGRYGFGIATERVRWKIPKWAAKLASPVDIDGAMQWLTHDEALSELPALYDQIRQRRVGLFERRMAWWENRLLADPPGPSSGVSQQRRVVYAPEGRSLAYALYRTRRADLDHGLDVLIQEIHGVTPEAERAVWQFLFSIDLVDSLDAWNLAVDHPLRWWIQDVRKVSRQVHDGLWLRLVNVQKALEWRRYAVQGRLTIRVHDETCLWNDQSWALEVSADGQSHCTETGGPVDLECSADCLASVYLGGATWREMARAGAVQGAPHALRLADQLFDWHERPWCAERF